MAVAFLSVNISANAGKADGGAFLGYIDNDKNGVNDLYFDANGDGINDLNGEMTMIQNIKYIDENRDGINDLFSDNDGDGVNDIYIFSKYTPIIDIDDNGINDITGIRYKKGFYSGFLYGSSVEEYGIILEDYEDKNGDFSDDHIKEEIESKRNDRFVDDDGDGICDNRDVKMMPRRYKNLSHDKNKKGRN